MKEKMGATLFCIGLMTAESDTILMPLLLIAAGIWMAKGLVTGD